MKIKQNNDTSLKVIAALVTTVLITSCAQPTGSPNTLRPAVVPPKPLPSIEELTVLEKDVLSYCQDRAVDVGFYKGHVSVARCFHNLRARTKSIGKGTPYTIGSGSGIVVNEMGDTLTAYHVVVGCQRVHVSANTFEADASIVAKDAMLDLAVLRTISSVKTYARVKAETIALGEPAIAMGFPLSGVLSSGTTVTSGIVNAKAGMKDDGRMFQFSAPVQPGNSGGPVFDQNGNVMGIVVSSLNALAFLLTSGSSPQNVGFAIKNDRISTFLSSNNIKTSPGKNGDRQNEAQIAERSGVNVTKITCMH
jgi:S1-C subfamily serine protease